MKPLHGNVTTSRSCSCTSCLYKSASDRPSVRKLLAQGSRIDKLYLEKYIPLREKKLLGKLVRTRAVYDDIRAQLLSESNLSISDKADLKPRKKMPRVRKGKELDVEKSSAILELVNLIDKGAELGSRKLNECCSCCSCDSTTPLHEQEGRVHRHGRAHISSRSSMVSGHRARDEHRVRRQVRLKAKHILSDPTLKLSGLIKRESKALMKKFRGNKAEPAFEVPFNFNETYDENKRRSRRKFDDFKQLQSGMGESIRESLSKLRQSRTRIADRIKAGTKSSLERIRNADQNFKIKIGDKVRKSRNPQQQELQNYDEDYDDDFFNLQKDSLMKYREDMKRKRFYNWECDLECDPDECVPEECFKIITKKRLRKRMNKIYNDKTEAYKKIEETSSASEVGIQANNQKDAAETVTKNKKKISIDIDKKTSATGTRVNIEMDKNKAKTVQATKQTKIKNSQVQDCFCENAETESTKRVLTEPVSKVTPEEQILNTKSVHELKEQSGSQSMKSSKTSQNISKHAQNGGLALRRCFCTLKLKPNKNKSKIKKTQQRARKAVSRNLETAKIGELPVLRGKHFTMTKTDDSNNKAGSTASFTTEQLSSGETETLETYKSNRKENSKPSRQGHLKSIDETMPQKQSVRISSDSSFGLEFYKNRGDYKLNDNLKNTNDRSALNKDKAMTKHLAHKQSQITSSGKSKYALTNHHLRRCFCTLKLAKAQQKINSHSRGTLTSTQSIRTADKSRPKVMDRATEKNEKNIMCECNPYSRLDLINKITKVNTRTKNSGTDQRKLEYTYSRTQKLNTRGKKNNVQSISNRLKNGGLVLKKEPLSREIKLSSEKVDKQVVRIGSSFSFEIEFFKERVPSIPESPQVEQAPKHIGQKTVMKNERIQGPVVKKHEKSSSAQVGKKEVLVSKLHNMAKNEKHNIKMVTSTGTETSMVKEEMYPKIEMVTKSTKMKKVDNIFQQLEPYECEPNFCVPGQCDPIQCLERIQLRDKVKSREFGVVTNTLRKRSTSSAMNTNKRGRDAINQSYRKATKNKQFNFNPLASNSKLLSAETVRKSSTRQAVRIGSNFSFNLEFSKNVPSIIYNSKHTMGVRPIMTKHRGEKYSGKPEKQRTSQTIEIKKNNQASGIRPMLKRCFCTLKLQNKKNISKMTTVMPVMVQKIPSKYKEELIRLQELLPTHSDKYGTCSSKYSSIFCSSYSCSSNSTTYKDKSYREGLRKRIICNLGSISKTSLEKSDHKGTLTGVNQYYKGSFYALNMHVQEKQKKPYKLEPYECEPGICIPGQCDPIECQKLIMKRLMKKVSTMTSTERRSQSISSGTSYSKSKKQQYSGASPEIPKAEKDQGINYKTLPKEKAHKQAVRVGSSFSFNIEFSKDRSTAHDDIQKSKVNKRQSISSTNTNSKKRKSRSTRGSQVQRQHRTSQSVVAMHHKGSNVSAKMKRCFCTLKLQKKGRKSKTAKLKDKTNYEQKKISVKTEDVGQNTNKFKQYPLYDLDPNECEPNFCIPGECDPHECLKRIKNRGRRNTKDFGTYMNTKKLSASSMTSSQKKASKGKQAHFKETKLKTVNVPVEKEGIKPSRQAVRIGSNFSFNVEFYKDRSLSDDEVTRSSTESPIKTFKTDRSVRQKSIQDSKSMRHRDSQVEVPAKYEKSTRTDSVLKRCFCVLKSMNAVKSKISNPVVKPNSKKVKNPKPKKVKNPKPQITNTSKFAQTRTNEPRNRDIRILNLEPYECEPGVCVPGECDPRVCEARIRKRNANLNKMSSTEGSSTRSMSTLFQPPKSSKSTASYAHINEEDKKKQQHVKRQAKSKKRLKSNERSAVRIGSNFSFNIEFYKERNPNFESIQHTAKAIKEYKHTGAAAATETMNIKPVTKARGVDYESSLHNRESQVDLIQKVDRASGVGLMLKRCFCTLALQKHTESDTKHSKVINAKKKVHLEKSTKGTETPLKNIYDSKLYNLEPYECEPGVCVPGQCDPHECIKLIKKRQRRDVSSETMKHSLDTATDARRYKRDQNSQSLNEHKKSTVSKRYKPVRRISTSSKNQNRRARQAVRIGSNFSFSIEFSSENDRTTGNDIMTPKKRHHTKSTTSKHRKSTSPSHKETQDKTRVRHVDSQVLPKTVTSTMTQVAPFLKRCFCTLALKKSKSPKKKEKVIVPYETVKVKKNKDPKPPNQATKKNNTYKPKYTLHPNECEPGICVPGECDPYECLKKIQKRKQSTMSNTDVPRERDIKISTKTSNAKTKTTGIKNNNSHEAGDHSHIGTRRQSQSPNKRNRQAVRIGSNFSFNIEFFKDKSFDNSHEAILPMEHATKSNLITPKTQKTKHAVSSNQAKLVDRQLQSHSHQTESKASGVGPLMKRCFCTLKLQKVGKQHQKKPVKPKKKTKNNSASVNLKNKIDESRIIKEAGTRTKKYYLEPYECEPNTCIPGQCDPLECYERIKLRNVKEFGTDTSRPLSRSVSCSSECKAHNIKKIQTPLEKARVSRSSKNQVKQKPERISYTPTAGKENRQSVRFGTNLNFDVEFSKDMFPKAMTDTIYETPSALNDNTDTRTKQIKTISQASDGPLSSSQHRAQQAYISQESKGSGIAPLLKRCFCTLTLHSTETNKMSRAKDRTHIDSAQNNFSSRNQKVTSKVLSRNAFHRIPRQSDLQCPLNKKGGIHIKSRIPSINEQCFPRAYNMPFRTTRRSKILHTKNYNIPRTVEQPRFPFLYSQNHCHKYGSDISYNFDFHMGNMKTSKNSEKKTRRDSKACVRAQNQNTEEKACIADKALNTCFHTPPFNKKKHENILNVGRVDNVFTHSPFKSQYYVYQMTQFSPTCPEECTRAKMKTASTKINNKYLDPKPTQGLQLVPSKHHDLNTSKIMKNQETNNCVCTCMINKQLEPEIIPNQDRKTKKKKDKNMSAIEHLYCANLDLAQPKKNKPSKKKDSNEPMETILPYTPKNFSTRKTKTFLRKGKINETYHDCCSLCSCLSNKNNICKTKSKHAKMLTGKDEKLVLPQQVTGLQKFFCTCKNLFSKTADKKVKQEPTKSDPNNVMAVVKPNVDVLKKSKSERAPAKCPFKQLKKSKSVKGISLKMEGNDDQKKKYSKLQAGDIVKPKPAVPRDKTVKPGQIKSFVYLCTKPVRKNKVTDEKLQITVKPKISGDKFSDIPCETCTAKKKGFMQTGLKVTFSDKTEDRTLSDETEDHTFSDKTEDHEIKNESVICLCRNELKKAKKSIICLCNNLTKGLAVKQKTNTCDVNCKGLKNQKKDPKDISKKKLKSSKKHKGKGLPEQQQIKTNEDLQETSPKDLKSSKKSKSKGLPKQQQIKTKQDPKDTSQKDLKSDSEGLPQQQQINTKQDPKEMSQKDLKSSKKSKSKGLPKQQQIMKQDPKETSQKNLKSSKKSKSKDLPKQQQIKTKQDPKDTSQKDLKSDSEGLPQQQQINTKQDPKETSQKNLKSSKKSKSKVLPKQQQIKTKQDPKDTSQKDLKSSTKSNSDEGLSQQQQIKTKQDTKKTSQKDLKSSNKSNSKCIPKQQHITTDGDHKDTNSKGLPKQQPKDTSQKSLPKVATKRGGLFGCVQKLKVSYDIIVHGKSCPCCVCKGKNVKQQDPVDTSQKSLPRVEQNRGVLSKLYPCVQKLSDYKNRIIGHGKSCTCCICNRRNAKQVQGAKICVMSKELRKKEAKKKPSVSRFNKKPCICGSSVCKKESKKRKKVPKGSMSIMFEKLVKKKKKRRRRCKSRCRRKKMSNKEKAKKVIKQCLWDFALRDPILRKVITFFKIKVPKKKRRNKCLCGKYLEKKKAIEMKKKKIADKKREKKMMKKQRKMAAKQVIINKKRRKLMLKNLEKRIVGYGQQDAIRRLQRRKQEQKWMKEARKFRDSGDCVLLADSAFDVARLGCTAAGDVLRSTYRAVTDPRRTMRSIEMAKKDPKKALKSVKTALVESGVGSTFKRVKLRMKHLEHFKKVKQKLEENPATNYLVHVADKDPRKKLEPRKKKKFREPLDFQCSLYMGSLRRRPWLWVYYKCPWFYPHWLGMLNIWKQFTDIILFLLAAVVWSPCILLMEACRAMMCCMFCTG